MPTNHRPPPISPAIPSGSLRVWWIDRATGERQDKRVDYIDDAKFELRSLLLPSDPYERGGLEVYKDGQWSEWLCPKTPSEIGLLRQPGGF